MAFSAVCVGRERVSVQETCSDPIVYMPEGYGSTVYVSGKHTLIRRGRFPRPNYISITLKHYTSSKSKQYPAPIRPVRPLKPHALRPVPSPSGLEPTNKTKTTTLHETLFHPPPLALSLPAPSPQHLSQPSFGRLARRTAYMLAPDLAPINNHDATAPAPLVPGLAAPAAVPPPVPRLVRARRQRALGHRDGADVRRRRVWDRPGDGIGARLPRGGRGPSAP